MTDTGGPELTDLTEQVDHMLDVPYVDAQGQRTALCSCGLRLTASTIDELQPMLVEHVEKPLHEATQSELRCIACNTPTTFTAWPLCDACKRLQHTHVGERRLPNPSSMVDKGATTLTLLVVLTSCATIGAALRYGGWARLAIVLVAVALLGLGLRLDARPKVRR